MCHESWVITININILQGWLLLIRNVPVRASNSSTAIWRTRNGEGVNFGRNPPIIDAKRSQISQLLPWPYGLMLGSTAKSIALTPLTFIYISLKSLIFAIFFFNTMFLGATICKSNCINCLRTRIYPSRWCYNAGIQRSYIVNGNG